MHKPEYNLKNIKQDFPIFQRYPNLVYLDNAATSQKPQQVIEAVKEFYEQHNANIHRGMYSLSQDATELFEQARMQVATFVGAASSSEIVFTSNASEAINLVAYGWARKFLHPGDIIITTEMEHHSNIVPWLRLKEEYGIEVVFLPISNTYEIHYQTLLNESIDLQRIKLITIAHASNVLGTINPINDIVDFLKTNNIVCKVLVDAAQSIPHLPVNVTNLGCDFLAFSSHKMLGPSGVGVLWAKKELLEVMDPLLVGSHMVNTVFKDSATWSGIPDKFETGTRNLEGVIGLGAAIKYLQALGLESLMAYEELLTQYALRLFHDSQDNIRLYGPTDSKKRVGVFSFTFKGIHAHDVAEILNRKHIAVRSGHHCAQTVMQFINQPATTRASLYLYNTKEDIEKLFEGFSEVKKIFHV